MTTKHDPTDSTPSAGRTVRTLLVDDSPIITEILQAYLTATGQFDIVGIAQNGWEAVEKNTTLHPDLIVMDINMPELNGLRAAEMIKQNANPPLIVLLTLHASQAYRERATALGVDGFCDKLDIDQDLLPAIAAAMATD